MENTMNIRVLIHPPLNFYCSTDLIAWKDLYCSVNLMCSRKHTHLVASSFSQLTSNIAAVTCVFQQSGSAQKVISANPSIGLVITCQKSDKIWEWNVNYLWALRGGCLCTIATFWCSLRQWQYLFTIDVKKFTFSGFINIHISWKVSLFFKG